MCATRLAILSLGTTLALLGCSRVDHLGRPPGFTDPGTTQAHRAMVAQAASFDDVAFPGGQDGSLWRGDRQSLLGDRRARRQGDILTVVIEIDEKAEISNSTQRARSGNESVAMPHLLGLPQRLDEELPNGASSTNAVSVTSSSAASGDGSVQRNEKLTLRVAATILDILPNGVLQISGTQELRVNFELRELQVAGYVRPEDISRQNEITYDKIASARVSYGGRGQITDVQQPRYGQQVLDMVLPF